jgi:very-short-patch-repair endonuclease
MLIKGRFTNRACLKNKRRLLRQDATSGEKLMWNILKDKRLLELRFRRQYNIDYYIVDFYCHELKLVLELDGNIHDLVEIQLYDQKREIYLKSRGYNVIRITNDDLFGNPELIIKKLAQIILNH